MRIGIVAPARGIDRATADRLRALAADRAELIVHEQCFLSEGHFAGPDDVRAAALLELASDPAIDAIWFARGGYGSMRLLPLVLPKLDGAALSKTWIGYSDTGALLSALHRRGARVAHAPMPADVRRPGGDEAVRRTLDWLHDGSGTEGGLGAEPAAAFNLVILGHLAGTPHLFDLTGYELLVEEVAEPLYRIDRVFAQLAEAGILGRLAGLRLGRVSEIAPNDPDFGMDEEAIAGHWCAVAGIPFRGRADIGHDVRNKVVPFGAASLAPRG